MIVLTPKCDLNDPRLTRHYSDADFQAGNVAIPDCGLLYGYLYRPVRFTGAETGVMGTSEHHPSKPDGNGSYTFGSKFPWCQTRQEAVAFLKEHGYYGRVQRYCDCPEHQRGESKEMFLLYGMKPFVMACEPWVTAGITDVVNAPAPNVYHGHLLARTDDTFMVHVRESVRG